MIAFFIRILEWFKAFFFPTQKGFKTVSLGDLPDKENVKNNIVYIIGEENFEWCLVFQCPCGCQDIIYLNLLTDTRPCWRIEKHEKECFSISPSINRIVGCKSHFFLKENSIQWV